jgi:flagellar FliL protein
MANADDKNASEESTPKKKSKLFLILILLVLLGAGGGGAIGYLGLIDLSGGKDKSTDVAVDLPSIENTAFVVLPQLIVPLGEAAKAHHLRAQLSVETTKEYAERVEQLKPRLIDMLNTYLRAVEESELIEPSRFQRLQLQILRRAKLVAGDEAVKNILIQEFVLQ